MTEFHIEICSRDAKSVEGQPDGNQVSESCAASEHGEQAETLTEARDTKDVALHLPSRKLFVKDNHTLQHGEASASQPHSSSSLPKSCSAGNRLDSLLLCNDGGLRRSVSVHTIPFNREGHPKDNLLCKERIFLQRQ